MVGNLEMNWCEIPPSQLRGQPVRVVGGRDQVEPLTREQSAQGSLLYPVMAIYTPDKPIPFAPPEVAKIQTSWKRAVMSARQLPSLE
jgi:hypothetical protein